MFEAAELGQKIKKSEYKKKEPILRDALLTEQFKLKSDGPSIIIIIEGVDNVSKGEVINRLGKWLDPHGLDITAFGPKTDEELARPRFWRYWRTLPARGRIGIFSGSWYTGTIIDHCFGKINHNEFEHHMRRVARFEQMLAKDGAIIIKFWLHMSKQQQKGRFKHIAHHEFFGSIISETDQKLHRHYKAFKKSAEHGIRLTDTALAPWQIIESENWRYRDITIGEKVLARLKAIHQTDILPAASVSPISTLIPKVQHPTVLDAVELSLKMAKSTYKANLRKWQSKLNLLTWEAFHKGIRLILLFEGWDAAGKGGAIRRITQAIDTRISQVISIAAPSDEERAHHYLWRFWRHIPREGRAIIYDRSWYGRVLVERVEGFASPMEWQRAPAEINEFEAQLCEHKDVLLKFWIHIDKDEQLRRFKEREQVPYKQYKITDEDWRNRTRWDDYELAVHDMVMHTSTEYAPWTLVPGNDKYYARIFILQTVCDRLKEQLKNTKG